MTTLDVHAATSCTEARSYLKTLERRLTQPSRFNNDLLYGMSAICYEKLLVGLLASKGINAEHHTPIALYMEASKQIELPACYKETAKMLTLFESICSMDGFGYKTPTNEQLLTIINGLICINSHIETCIDLQ